MKSLYLVAIPAVIAMSIGCKPREYNSDVRANFGVTEAADGSNWTCKELKQAVAEAKGLSEKEIKCHERKNDATAAFYTDDKNDLWRVFFAKKKSHSASNKLMVCQATSDVKSFRLSEHEKDWAAAYFEKNGDLYMIGYIDPKTRSDGQYFSSCPASNNVKVLMSNVDKYTVVSNSNTTLVNMALSTSGEFKAWDDTNVLIKASNISEFLMSPCYGVTGKSFNSYVAFIRSKNGYIGKVKGDEDWNDSKWDKSNTYSSIDSFMTSQNVCK